MFGKERLCFLLMSKQSHLTLFFHLHPFLSKPILESTDPEDNTQLELPA